MISFLGYILAIVVGIVICLLVMWFGLGAFHGYLHKNRTGFGDAATKQDIERLESYIRATITAKH